MGVFVSYSSRDDVAVRAVTQGLRRAHEQVWLDEELGGGDAWWRTILEQIRRCDVFVFALSQNSLRSKPCRAELAYAQALGIPVLPVQIGPVDSMRTNPVSQVQAIDYQHPTADSGIQLIAALHERRSRRQDLPNPLPAEPPLPFEYLMRLGAIIDSPHLSPGEQASVVAELRVGLVDEEDETARRDIANLLRALRDRPDVTYRTVNDVDEILRAAPSLAGAAASGPHVASSASAPPAAHTAHATPAGWYPAPGRPDLVRYWDGARWTDRTAPGGPGQYAAAAGQQYAQQQAQPARHGQHAQHTQPGQPQQPGQQPVFGATPGVQRKPGHGFTITALILSAIATLLLPILFGPAAIAFAVTATVRKEPNGKVALFVAIGATILGMIIGAIVGMSGF